MSREAGPVARLAALHGMAACRRLPVDAAVDNAGARNRSHRDQCADGFRVTRLSGEVLGERSLWHDHQNEQPFTRDRYGVKIPAGVSQVRIQARDQKHGYGGKSIDVALPARR